jgi:hypothetical protein
MENAISRITDTLLDEKACTMASQKGLQGACQGGWRYCGSRAFSDHFFVLHACVDSPLMTPLQTFLDADSHQTRSPFPYRQQPGLLGMQCTSSRGHGRSRPTGCTSGADRCIPLRQTKGDRPTQSTQAEYIAAVGLLNKVVCIQWILRRSL